MNCPEPAQARLLLVDDRPENLLALTAILEDPEYQLLTAASGEEALKIALKEPLTVVLLDVLMPGMDGFEVATHLKELGRTRDVPILFLTALATDMKHIYRAYEVGAVDYIVKPLDPEAVRKKVRVFVNLVRQREQIEQQAAALREVDRREYELKLAELRVAGDRRYRKLVEGINHAIGWTMDETLRFTFVSRQAPRILGHPMQRFLEPDFWEGHLHPDDREAMLDICRRALAEGVEVVSNHRMLTEDGRTLWFHTGVSGERRDGEAAELHGISVDVTEIKRAEEEARRATHVREELLAIVAHDLRNPLSSIQTSASSLERVAAGVKEPRVEKAANMILRSAARMDRLIGDLLDFALIEAERMTIERQAFDAGSLVQEGMEMLKPLAATKRIGLEGKAEQDLLLDGDRDRVLQVLSNIVGNAIKFTPDNGSVAVHVGRSGNEGLFAVSDTGPGMPDEDESRIWNRFWQAKRGRASGGVGLGLSIARGLVEAHGGRIWVESRIGVGTTFYFTIPLALSDHGSPRLNHRGPE
jgi:PAS domain S-box-containing protein